MVPTSTCPDARKWQPLLLGQLPKSEMEALGQHLAECGTCLQTIRGVQADDTVVEAMRSLAKSTDQPISESVQGLIQRLKGMPPPAGARASEDVTVAPTPPAGEITQERYDFLTPAQAPDELGRLGPYRILKVLGAGGMGIVFQAEDVQLQRQVALKVMKAEAAQNPSARERFLREARAAAALEHENIVTIYQVGEERGVPFLAMQWLKGMSLAERLKRPGPLTVPQVLRLGRHIACGLQAAHAHGLIHRDIKPANLWLENVGQVSNLPGSVGKLETCPTFRIKILDFGLARAVEGGAHLTQTGAIVGTPAYMAPEQGRGLPVDHRADLFSLGCVLYQMLTGQRPFAGADTMAILSSLALDTPAAPHTLNPQCPAALSRLVMKLLEKDPAARPASAQEVIKALADLDNLAAAVVAAAAANPRAGIAVPMDTTVTMPPPAPETSEVLKTSEVLSVLSTSRRRWPLVAAAVLLALIPLSYFFGGQIIRVVTNQGELVIVVDDRAVEIKIVHNGVLVQDTKSKREFTLTAGKGEIEVLEKDGIKLATKKFELTRGGKTTVSVTLQELADARKLKGLADLDRRAAEWVLSLGGTVTIDDGKERAISAGKELPAGPWMLRRIDLNNNKQVNDAGLKHLAGLQGLQTLYLNGTPVADAGLKHLAGLQGLQTLHLKKTAVTNAGLKALAGLTSLQSLSIGANKVTGAGLKGLAGMQSLHTLNLDATEVTAADLKELAGLKSLQGLSLWGTSMTGARLKELAGLKSLQRLNLGGSTVTDAGLKELAGLINLRDLRLHVTQVTDAGLKELAGLKSLNELDLSRTQVTDSGLAHLHGLADLATLDLKWTPVTSQGIAALRKALPGCQIMSNVRPAATDPDRRAAEWVLSIGGTISIKENGTERQTGAVGDLPRGAFELTVLNLYGTKVTDDGLVHFKDCKNFTYLCLDGTPVTDAGLAHFKDCKNLTLLDLRATKVSDAGLAHFKDCKNLRTLELGGTQVSDAGLAHFKDCKNLTYLSLGGTQVSDAGLALFKDCKNLTSLNLALTKVSDAGLAQFKDCKNLTHLNLHAIKVSDAGLAHFKDCKNLTQIYLDGTQVSGAGLAQFKDCKNLTHLSLHGAQLSDPGLAHFKDCKNLTWLDLQSTRVSDAGLAHFKDCKNLTSLNLSATQVSDAGLAHFKDCKNLTSLALAGTKVSGPGLADFKDCKNLTQIYLNRTQVSDAGLAHFKDCKNLLYLNLDHTQVSDAGLGDLESLTSLTDLNLISTRISLRGHQLFKIALPKCQITNWSEPNRSVAESVLALGGTVAIGPRDRPESRPIKVAADLPGDYFQVRRVSLAGVAKPLGNLPEQLSWLRFPKFDRLESIDLSGITGLEYGFLVPIHGLRELRLANAGLNDAALANLPKLPALKRLVLDGNDIRGTGLAHLSGQPELIDLSLGCPSLTDLFAKNLAELKQVKRLSLAGSGLTDAGIKHLAGLPNLEWLNLRDTKASAAGVAELQKALPKCKIEWDGKKDK